MITSTRAADTPTNPKIKFKYLDDEAYPPVWKDDLNIKASPVSNELVHARDMARRLSMPGPMADEGGQNSSSRYKGQEEENQ